MLLDSYMKTRMSELKHLDATPYDPAKAHAYYIANRNLKGRRPGAAKVEIAAQPGPKAVVKATTKKVVAKPVKKTTAQLKTEANTAVAALQAKLTKLKAVLAELTKQAQARSGVTTATTTAKKAAASNKPKTAAQKKAAADAHAYYEKHKTSTPAKASTTAEKEKQLNAQIKTVEAKIKAIKAQLAEAAKKLKAKSKPKVETAS